MTGNFRKADSGARVDGPEMAGYRSTTGRFTSNIRLRSGRSPRKRLGGRIVPGLVGLEVDCLGARVALSRVLSRGQRRGIFCIPRKSLFRRGVVPLRILFSRVHLSPARLSSCCRRLLKTLRWPVVETNRVRVRSRADNRVPSSCRVSLVRCWVATLKCIVKNPTGRLCLPKNGMTAALI